MSTTPTSAGIMNSSTISSTKKAASQVATMTPAFWAMPMRPEVFPYWVLGELIRHRGEERGEGDVRERLCDEPADRHLQRAARHGDQQQRQGQPPHDAHHDPGAPSAQARGGPIGEPSADRVEEDGGQGTGRDHHGRHRGLLGGHRGEGLDLELDGHRGRGGEERNEQAELGEHDAGDEPDRALAIGLDPMWGG